MVLCRFLLMSHNSRKLGGLESLASLPAILIARILNLSVKATVTDAAIRSKFSVDTQVVAAPFSFFDPSYVNRGKSRTLEVLQGLPPKLSGALLVSAMRNEG